MKSVTPRTIKARRLRWIAALESGKYKQGHGSLVFTELNTEKYCCLGVACKISNKFKFGQNNTISFRDSINNKRIYIGSYSSHIKDYLNLTAVDVEFAIHMNDIKRNTFYEIATHFRQLWNLPRKIEE